MGFIYKITNDINDKVYIGQTSLTVEHRFKEHLIKAHGLERQNLPLYNAMRKYGVEHFQVETIEETDNLNEREKYWIAQYNSYENGYNATIGGEGCPKLDYDFIVDLYKKCNNASEVARQIGSDRHVISRIVKSYGLEVKPTAEIARDNRSKEIEQYDKDNNLLNIYPSAAEAARQLNKTPAHIIKCANKKRKTAYGYIWKWRE